MKKKLSILILLFIIISLVITILNINNQHKNDVIEQTSLDDITNELVIEEVIEEQDQYEIAIHEMQEKMKKIESIEDKKEWFIEYKKIIYEYIELIDPPETIYDYYSEEEINLICRVVETETYQCDFESKVNVANVILNRIDDEKFGGTVKEVVTSTNQFVYERKIISEDTILAVEYAFLNEDTTQGALYFNSNNKTETFCGREWIFQDEAGHNFY